jgi:hypothetical protein
MVAAARARQDFTHFVSLPINSPDIQAAFQQFKTQVLTIKLISLFPKIAIYLSAGLHNKRPSYRRTQKRTTSTLKHEISSPFSIFWG